MNPKPDPESVIKILDFFNSDPRKTFYVGDSLLDQQTARAAGVVFISYKNNELDADFYADSMMVIETIIEGIS
jgi:phosphoglycolate phosphatase-like HAD superfamily hydrolase